MCYLVCVKVGWTWLICHVNGGTFPIARGEISWCQETVPQLVKWIHGINPGNLPLAQAGWSLPAKLNEHVVSSSKSLMFLEDEPLG